MRKSPVIYMQNLLNCDEEKKMNDTKVILNSVNGDLCANAMAPFHHLFPLNKKKRKWQKRVLFGKQWA